VDPILLASLAALVLGPLVLEWTRGNWTLAAVDAFALVAVGGLVGVHILPQSFVLGGWFLIPSRKWDPRRALTDEPIGGNPVRNPWERRTR
jgi:hypothetical protein